MQFRNVIILQSKLINVLYRFLEWAEDNLIVNNYNPHITGKSRPAKIDFLSISGSYSYGIPTETSDYDIKGIFTLPTENLFTLDNRVKWFKGNHKKIPEIPDVEIDYDIYETQTYIQYVRKPSINHYDCIFSPYYINPSVLNINKLRQMVEQSISKKLIKAFLGMAYHNYTTGKNRDVKNPKVNLIIMRCYLEAKYIIQHKKIEMCIPKLLDNFTFTKIDKKIFRTLYQYKKENKQLSDNEAEAFMDWIKLAKSRVEKDTKESNLKERPGMFNKFNDFLFKVRLNNLEFLDDYYSY
ncbi:MAG: hypothetical protein GF317_00700 [Candidatus Lokiarchaeota archaeon]|nr:hypothetical protein [Candidatus Lokiarchaeota archaeon]